MLLAIVSALLAIWLLFMIFTWTRGGLGKGRKFGNRIATHLGMSNNLFHSVLENGVNGPSLQLLATLEMAGISLQEASVQLAPWLQRGLDALESRFGNQNMIELAKPIVTALWAQWETSQLNNTQ